MAVECHSEKFIDSWIDSLAMPPFCHFVVVVVVVPKKRHRMRMGTRPAMAGHVFFGTCMLVMLPSYYFCYRKREHQEEVIEMMMKYNRFGHATELPPEPPLEEHPFWTKIEEEERRRDEAAKHAAEYRGMIKERKEWQKKEDKSFEEIFSEKR